MQITIDTAACSGAQLAAVARFFEALAALSTAPATVTGGKPIEPADRPDTGRTPPPAIVQAATQAAAAVNAPPVPQAPALDPAAIFGQVMGGASPVNPADALGTVAGLFRDVPPVPSSSAVPSAAPSVPVVPPLPRGVGAFIAPPPAPTAPTVPAASASAAPGGTEVDVRGLPWDGRIHTSTRAKNQDGSWRQRRGINDEAMVKRIEAELLAAMAAKASNAYAPSAVPQPPAADGTPTTFGAMMEAVSKLITDKRVTPDAVNAALMQHLQMPTMIGLGSRPDLIPRAWGIVQSLLVPA